MSKNWAAIDPHRIATVCSPRHIQTVLEDQKRDLLALESQRDELVAALKDLFGADMEHVLMGDGKPDQVAAIARARAAIAAATPQETPT